MTENEWNATTDATTVAHRAGGRRHFNMVRQVQAIVRRMKVVELLAKHGFLRGSQTAIAKELGVHRSTVCRDLEWLRHIEMGWEIPELREKSRIHRQYFNSRFP